LASGCRLEPRSTSSDDPFADRCLICHDLDLPTETSQVAFLRPDNMIDYLHEIPAAATGSLLKLFPSSFLNRIIKLCPARFQNPVQSLKFRRFDTIPILRKLNVRAPKSVVAFPLIVRRY
jgi:hypothetical protein